MSYLDIDSDNIISIADVAIASSGVWYRPGFEKGVSYSFRTYFGEISANLALQAYSPPEPEPEPEPEAFYPINMIPGPLSNNGYERGPFYFIDFGPTDNAVSIKKGIEEIREDSENVDLNSSFTPYTSFKLQNSSDIPIGQYETFIDNISQIKRNYSDLIVIFYADDLNKYIGYRALWDEILPINGIYQSPRSSYTEFWIKETSYVIDALNSDTHDASELSYQVDMIYMYAKISSEVHLGERIYFDNVDIPPITGNANFTDPSWVAGNYQNTSQYIYKSQYPHLNDNQFISFGLDLLDSGIVQETYGFVVEYTDETKTTVNNIRACKDLVLVVSDNTSNNKRLFTCPRFIELIRERINNDDELSSNEGTFSYEGHGMKLRPSRVFRGDRPILPIGLPDNFTAQWFCTPSTPQPPNYGLVGFFHVNNPLEEGYLENGIEKSGLWADWKTPTLGDSGDDPIHGYQLYYGIDGDFKRSTNIFYTSPTSNAGYHLFANENLGVRKSFKIFTEPGLPGYGYSAGSILPLVRSATSTGRPRYLSEYAQSWNQSNYWNMPNVGTYGPGFYLPGNTDLSYTTDNSNAIYANVSLFVKSENFPQPEPEPEPETMYPEPEPQPEPEPEIFVYPEIFYYTSGTNTTDTYLTPFYSTGTTSIVRSDYLSLSNDEFLSYCVGHMQYDGNIKFIRVEMVGDPVGANLTPEIIAAYAYSSFAGLDEVPSPGYDSTQNNAIIFREEYFINPPVQSNINGGSWIGWITPQQWIGQVVNTYVYDAVQAPLPPPPQYYYFDLVSINGLDVSWVEDGVPIGTNIFKFNYPDLSDDEFISYAFDLLEQSSGLIIGGDSFEIKAFEVFYISNLQTQINRIAAKSDITGAVSITNTFSGNQVYVKYDNLEAIETILGTTGLVFNKIETGTAESESEAGPEPEPEPEYDDEFDLKDYMDIKVVPPVGSLPIIVRKLNSDSSGNLTNITEVVSGVTDDLGILRIDNLFSLFDEGDIFEVESVATARPIESTNNADSSEALANRDITSNHAYERTTYNIPKRSVVEQQYIQIVYPQTIPESWAPYTYNDDNGNVIRESQNRDNILVNYIGLYQRSHETNIILSSESSEIHNRLKYNVNKINYLEKYTNICETIKTNYGYTFISEVNCDFMNTECYNSLFAHFVRINLTMAICCIYGVPIDSESIQYESNITNVPISSEEALAIRQNIFYGVLHGLEKYGFNRQQLELDLKDPIWFKQMYSMVSQLIAHDVYNAGNNSDFYISIVASGTDAWTINTEGLLSSTIDSVFPDSSGTYIPENPNIEIVLGSSLYLLNFNPSHPLQILDSNNQVLSVTSVTGQGTENGIITFTPINGGIYKYKCSNHPNMEGKISVLLGANNIEIPLDEDGIEIPGYRNLEQKVPDSVGLTLLSKIHFPMRSLNTVTLSKRQQYYNAFMMYNSTRYLITKYMRDMWSYSTDDWYSLWHSTASYTDTVPTPGFGLYKAGEHSITNITPLNIAKWYGVFKMVNNEEDSYWNILSNISDEKPPSLEEIGTFDGDFRIENTIYDDSNGVLKVKFQDVGINSNGRDLKEYKILEITDDFTKKGMKVYDNGALRNLTETVVCYTIKENYSRVSGISIMLRTSLHDKIEDQWDSGAREALFFFMNYYGNKSDTANYDPSLGPWASPGGVPGMIQYYQDNMNDPYNNFWPVNETYIFDVGYYPEYNVDTKLPWMIETLFNGNVDENIDGYLELNFRLTRAPAGKLCIIRSSDISEGMELTNSQIDVGFFDIPAPITTGFITRQVKFLSGGTATWADMYDENTDTAEDWGNPYRWFTVRIPCDENDIPIQEKMPVLYYIHGFTQTGPRENSNLMGQQHTTGNWFSGKRWIVVFPAGQLSHGTVSQASKNDLYGGRVGSAGSDDATVYTLVDMGYLSDYKDAKEIEANLRAVVPEAFRYLGEQPNYGWNQGWPTVPKIDTYGGINMTRSWQHNTVYSVSDFEYLRRVTTIMYMEYSSIMDLDRMYCSGFSQGAVMTFKTTQAFAHWFAAIAPCAGNYHDNLRKFAIDRQIPIIQYHGTEDTLISYGVDFNPNNVWPAPGPKTAGPYVQNVTSSNIHAWLRWNRASGYNDLSNTYGGPAGGVTMGDWSPLEEDERSGASGDLLTLNAILASKKMAEYNFGLNINQIKKDVVEVIDEYGWSQFNDPDVGKPRQLIVNEYVSALTTEEIESRGRTLKETGIEKCRVVFLTIWGGDHSVFTSWNERIYNFFYEYKLSDFYKQQILNQGFSTTNTISLDEQGRIIFNNIPFDENHNVALCNGVYNFTFDSSIAIAPFWLPELCTMWWNAFPSVKTVYFIEGSGVIDAPPNVDSSGNLVNPDEFPAGDARFAGGKMELPWHKTFDAWDPYTITETLDPLNYNSTTEIKEHNLGESLPNYSALSYYRGGFTLIVNSDFECLSFAVKGQNVYKSGGDRRIVWDLKAHDTSVELQSYTYRSVFKLESSIINSIDLETSTDNILGPDKNILIKCESKTGISTLRSVYPEESSYTPSGPSETPGYMTLEIFNSDDLVVTNIEIPGVSFAEINAFQKSAATYDSNFGYTAASMAEANYYTPLGAVSNSTQIPTTLTKPLSFILEPDINYGGALAPVYAGDDGYGNEMCFIRSFSHAIQEWGYYIKYEDILNYIQQGIGSIISESVYNTLANEGAYVAISTYRIPAEDQNELTRTAGPIYPFVKTERIPINIPIIDTFDEPEPEPEPESFISTDNQYFRNYTNFNNGESAYSVWNHLDNIESVNGYQWPIINVKNVSVDDSSNNRNLRISVSNIYNFSRFDENQYWEKTQSNAQYAAASITEVTNNGNNYLPPFVVLGIVENPNMINNTINYQFKAKVKFEESLSVLGVKLNVMNVNDDFISNYIETDSYSGIRKIKNISMRGSEGNLFESVSFTPTSSMNSVYERILLQNTDGSYNQNTNLPAIEDADGYFTLQHTRTTTAFLNPANLIFTLQILVRPPRYWPGNKNGLIPGSLLPSDTYSILVDDVEISVWLGGVTTDANEFELQTGTATFENSIITLPDSVTYTEPEPEPEPEVPPVPSIFLNGFRALVTDTIEPIPSITETGANYKVLKDRCSYDPSSQEMTITLMNNGNTNASGSFSDASVYYSWHNIFPVSSTTENIVNPVTLAFDSGTYFTAGTWYRNEYIINTTTISTIQGVTNYTISKYQQTGGSGPGTAGIKFTPPLVSGDVVEIKVTFSTIYIDSSIFNIEYYIFCADDILYLIESQGLSQGDDVESIDNLPLSTSDNYFIFDPVSGETINPDVVSNTFDISSLTLQLTDMNNNINPYQPFYYDKYSSVMYVLDNNNKLYFKLKLPLYFGDPNDVNTETGDIVLTNDITDALRINPIPLVNVLSDLNSGSGAGTPIGLYTDTNSYNRTYLLRSAETLGNGYKELYIDDAASTSNGTDFIKMRSNQFQNYNFNKDYCFFIAESTGSNPSFYFNNEYFNSTIDGGRIRINNTNICNDGPSSLNSTVVQSKNESTRNIYENLYGEIMSEKFVPMKDGIPNYVKNEGAYNFFLQISSQRYPKGENDTLRFRQSVEVDNGEEQFYGNSRDIRWMSDVNVCNPVFYTRSGYDYLDDYYNTGNNSDYDNNYNSDYAPNAFGIMSFSGTLGEIEDDKNVYGTWDYSKDDFGHMTNNQYHNYGETRDSHSIKYQYCGGNYRKRVTLTDYDNTEEQGFLFSNGACANRFGSGSNNFELRWSVDSPSESIDYTLFIKIANVGWSVGATSFADPSFLNYICVKIYNDDWSESGIVFKMSPQIIDVSGTSIISPTIGLSEGFDNYLSERSIIPNGDVDNCTIDLPAGYPEPPTTVKTTSQIYLQNDTGANLSQADSTAVWNTSTPIQEFSTLAFNLIPNGLILNGSKINIGLSIMTEKIGTIYAVTDLQIYANEEPQLMRNSSKISITTPSKSYKGTTSKSYKGTTSKSCKGTKYGASFCSNACKSKTASSSASTSSAITLSESSLKLMKIQNRNETEMTDFMKRFSNKYSEEILKNMEESKISTVKKDNKISFNIKKTKSSIIEKNVRTTTSGTFFVEDFTSDEQFKDSMTFNLLRNGTKVKLEFGAYANVNDATYAQYNQEKWWSVCKFYEDRNGYFNEEYVPKHKASPALNYDLKTRRDWLGSDAFYLSATEKRYMILDYPNTESRKWNDGYNNGTYESFLTACESDLAYNATYYNINNDSIVYSENRSWTSETNTYHAYGVNYPYHELMWSPNNSITYDECVLAFDFLGMSYSVNASTANMNLVQDSDEEKIVFIQVYTENGKTVEEEIVFITGFQNQHWGMHHHFNRNKHIQIKNLHRNFDVQNSRLCRFSNDEWYRIEVQMKWRAGAKLKLKTRERQAETMWCLKHISLRHDDLLPINDVIQGTNSQGPNYHTRLFHEDFKENMHTKENCELINFVAFRPEQDDAVITHKDGGSDYFVICKWDSNAYWFPDNISSTYYYDDNGVKGRIGNFILEDWINEELNNADLKIPSINHNFVLSQNDNGTFSYILTNLNENGIPNFYSNGTEISSDRQDILLQRYNNLPATYANSVLNITFNNIAYIVVGDTLSLSVLIGTVGWHSGVLALTNSIGDEIPLEYFGDDSYANPVNGYFGTQQMYPKYSNSYKFTSPGDYVIYNPRLDYREKGAFIYFRVIEPELEYIYHNPLISNWESPLHTHPNGQYGLFSAGSSGQRFPGIPSSLINPITNEPEDADNILTANNIRAANLTSNQASKYDTLQTNDDYLTALTPATIRWSNVITSDITDGVFQFQFLGQEHSNGNGANAPGVSSSAYVKFVIKTPTGENEVLAYITECSNVSDVDGYNGRWAFSILNDNYSTNSFTHSVYITDDMGRKVFLSNENPEFVFGVSWQTIEIHIPELYANSSLELQTYTDTDHSMYSLKNISIYQGSNIVYNTPISTETSDNVDVPLNLNAGDGNPLTVNPGEVTTFTVTADRFRLWTIFNKEYTTWSEIYLNNNLNVTVTPGCADTSTSRWLCYRENPARNNCMLDDFLEILKQDPTNPLYENIGNLNTWGRDSNIYEKEQVTRLFGEIVSQNSTSNTLGSNNQLDTTGQWIEYEGEYNGTYNNDFEDNNLPYPLGLPVKVIIRNRYNNGSYPYVSYYRKDNGDFMYDRECRSYNTSNDSYANTIVLCKKGTEVTFHNEGNKWCQMILWGSSQFADTHRRYVQNLDLNSTSSETQTVGWNEIGTIYESIVDWLEPVDSTGVSIHEFREGALNGEVRGDYDGLNEKYFYALEPGRNYTFVTKRTGFQPWMLWRESGSYDAYASQTTLNAERFYDWRRNMLCGRLEINESDHHSYNHAKARIAQKNLKTVPVPLPSELHIFDYNRLTEVLTAGLAPDNHGWSTIPAVKNQYGEYIVVKDAVTKHTIVMYMCAYHTNESGVINMPKWNYKEFDPEGYPIDTATNPALLPSNLNRGISNSEELWNNISKDSTIKIYRSNFGFSYNLYGVDEEDGNISIENYLIRTSNESIEPPNPDDIHNIFVTETIYQNNILSDESSATRLVEIQSFTKIPPASEISGVSDLYAEDIYLRWSGLDIPHMYKYRLLWKKVEKSTGNDVTSLATNLPSMDWCVMKSCNELRVRNDTNNPSMFIGHQSSDPVNQIGPSYDNPSGNSLKFPPTEYAGLGSDHIYTLCAEFAGVTYENGYGYVFTDTTITLPDLTITHGFFKVERTQGNSWNFQLLPEISDSPENYGNFAISNDDATQYDSVSYANQLYFCVDKVWHDNMYSTTINDSLFYPTNITSSYPGVMGAYGDEIIDIFRLSEVQFVDENNNVLTPTSVTIPELDYNGAPNLLKTALYLDDGRTPDILYDGDEVTEYVGRRGTLCFTFSTGEKPSGFRFKTSRFDERKPIGYGAGSAGSSIWDASSYGGERNRIPSSDDSLLQGGVPQNWTISTENSVDTIVGSSYLTYRDMNKEYYKSNGLIPSAHWFPRPNGYSIDNLSYYEGTENILNSDNYDLQFISNPGNQRVSIYSKQGLTEIKFRYKVASGISGTGIQIPGYNNITTLISGTNGNTDAVYSVEITPTSDYSDFNLSNAYNNGTLDSFTINSPLVEKEIINFIDIDLVNLGVFVGNSIYSITAKYAALLPIPNIYYPEFSDYPGGKYNFFIANATGTGTISISGTVKYSNLLSGPGIIKGIKIKLDTNRRKLESNGTYSNNNTGLSGNPVCTLSSALVNNYGCNPIIYGLADDGILTVTIDNIGTTSPLYISNALISELELFNFNVSTTGDNFSANKPLWIKSVELTTEIDGILNIATTITDGIRTTGYPTTKEVLNVSVQSNRIGYAAKRVFTNGIDGDSPNYYELDYNDYSNPQN